MAGQERKESLQLRLWNLNSTFKSPVGPGRLSFQISANQREEETSSNVTNIERHVLRVMTSLLMSSPPISTSHRKSSMHIFKIPQTQLQALLPFPAPPPERPGELFVIAYMHWFSTCKFNSYLLSCEKSYEMCN